MRQVRQHGHFTREYCPKSDEFYDLVINGGGLAGMATAVTMARSPAFQNRKILLVDKANAASPSSPIANPESKRWNSRVVAINPGSMQLIFSWGDKAWDKIENNGVGRICTMKIADAASNAHLTFGDSYEPLAWIVEASNLLNVFNDYLQQAIKDGKITLKNESSVVDVGSNSSGELLNLKMDPEEEESQRIWTKLVVVADGASSNLREQLLFRKVSFDYEQLGVVATLKLSNNQLDTAWQRFLPTGPVALLPLDEKHSSLVWSCDKSMASTLLALSDDEFVATLNDALHSKTMVQKPITQLVDQVRQISPKFMKPANERFNPPDVKKVLGKRMSFPLKLMHAMPTTQHRVVLVGDAAHTLHPMAGLGLNLGLGDVAELRRVLEDGYSKGEDIGTTEQLATFRLQRSAHSVPLAATTHILHHLYATQFPPVVAARSLGLTALDLLSPVKTFVTSQASQL